MKEAVLFVRRDKMSIRKAAEFHDIGGLVEANQ